MKQYIPRRSKQFLLYKQKMGPLSFLLLQDAYVLRGTAGPLLFYLEVAMSKPNTYQEILNSKIINARPSIIARKLGISRITASWLRSMVKEKHQEIVRNEIGNLSTDDISNRLGLPLELASWVKASLEKEITHTGGSDAKNQ